MKKSLTVLFFIISFLLFSQYKKEARTFYIQYNPKSDRHYNIKGKINFFEIFDGRKFIRFKYGVSMIRRVKTFKGNIISRRNLFEIIKHDNSSKPYTFFIVEKYETYYILYESDYMLRDIID